MKKAKLYVVVFAVLILTATVFAKDVIKVGVNPGPHEELMEIVKGILAEKGIELEIISFADFITPNLALADGSIDVNSYQHEPFLFQFNKDRKTDLVKLAPTIVFPISIYSQKVKSLSELKDKAIIAIPNDPTNAGRVLMLLEKAGLIKLKSGVGIQATVFDIIDNPKNLQFRELEAAQIPRALPDVDAAAINTTYAVSAGLDPVNDPIYTEDKDSAYVNILAVKRERLNDPLLQELVKAYHSKEVADYVEEKYKGSLVLGFTVPQ